MTNLWSDDDLVGDQTVNRHIQLIVVKLIVIAGQEIAILIVADFSTKIQTRIVRDFKGDLPPYLLTRHYHMAP